MTKKHEIDVVEGCGDSYAGTWEIPSEGKRGATCWRTHYGLRKAQVPWPETLLCRYCGKTFTREQIQKSWIQPVYFSQSDGTFNCGCLYIDTSGT